MIPRRKVKFQSVLFMTIGDRPWIIVCLTGTSKVSIFSSKSAGLYFTPELNLAGTHILGLSNFFTSLQPMFIIVPITKILITKPMTMIKCRSLVTWPWLWLFGVWLYSSQLMWLFSWDTKVEYRSSGSLHLKIWYLL